MRKAGLLIAGIVALFAAPMSLAQTAPPDATRMSVDQILRALLPKPIPRTFQPRGVVVVTPVDPPPSIDLYLNFDFDSAALTTDAQLTLKAVGTALSDPRLRNYRFKIDGHTDAVGTDAYNMDLSRRRAEAVRQHLMYYYSIDPTRMTAEGFGRTKLLDPQHPDDGINRRVQITTIIPEQK